MGGRKPPKWMIIAAVLVLAALIGTYFMTRTEPVAIPNVVGKDSATATAEIQQAGLQATVVQTRSDTIDKNKVIRTDPATGTLNPGSGVNVYVSTGPPIVPQVEPGATVQAVEQALKAQDLKPTRDATQDEFDNRAPKGSVLSVSPSPGTQLKLGDTVTLVLSKGPAPLKPLPDVKGKSENEARDLVREAGWEIETVRQQFDQNIDGGKVISTSPGAGQISEDKKVTLIVSNAVTVPDLRNKRLGEAKDILDKLGLNLEVAFGNNDGRSRVFGQGPGAGSRVQKGSTVRVGTSFFG